MLAVPPGRAEAHPADQRHDDQDHDYEKDDEHDRSHHHPEPRHRGPPIWRHGSALSVPQLSNEFDLPGCGEPRNEIANAVLVETDSGGESSRVLVALRQSSSHLFFILVEPAG